ncbi:odorant receptor 4-like [Cylas formicarius]|uniref:odorant receptor 4-like n=1 Tax=Cylas formicarius TaxID=197179 RepID=UPI002958B305|nr:odorant receptor 4-like [Cylas formicarius]
MNSIQSLRREYAEDFFYVNRWILRLAGLWCPENKNPYAQFAYNAYAIVVFLFPNLWFTSTEFVSLFYTYKREDAFIKNINFFLTHFMGAVKVIFWYFRGDCLIRIMKTLEDPDLHYKPFTEYNPGKISKRYKKIGVTYTLSFLALAHATLSSSYIPPIISVTRYMRSDANSTHLLPEKLPYYSWMPFAYNTEKLYLLAVAYQAGPMFSYAYSIVGIDTLFMNIMNNIGSNLTIMQGAFKTLRGRTAKIVGQPISSLRLHENAEFTDELYKQFRKISRHLQTVLHMSNQLESVYRYVTLCQITATLFILCTCLYLVSTTPLGSKQFIAECVYMAAMFFQLFVYCWFGNEVTLKCQELSNYIWECEWFATTTSFKKNLIFTMMRTKKPLYFTAGKFLPLTLPTFMSIIKTSYSIFALIKNTSE